MKMEIKGIARTSLIVLVVAVCIITIGEFLVWECEFGGVRQHPIAEIRESKSGETISGGILFQEGMCPYALSKDQAKAALNDDSRPGNTIELDHHPTGRTGNHYMTISAYLAMGYCCRSRLLTLPKKDGTLPAEAGSEFLAPVRSFGFSNVSLPWAKFEGLRDDPEVCRPHTKDWGNDAFGYVHVHDKVLECMNLVYLRGCEIAYFGEMINREAICPKREDGDQNGAGSLVVHIRSGDIFDPKGEGGRRTRFGQPPLQYYLHAFTAKKWNDITIVSAYSEDNTVNPVFKALEVMNTAGALGPNVRLYRNRPLLTDMREMLCADGLVFSRSSLSFMIIAHTRATVFFMPSVCGDGLYRRMKNPPIKAFVDNTTLLYLERPNVEAYGIRWQANAPKYTVFKEWNDNPKQLLEMVEYDGIEKLEKC